MTKDRLKLLIETLVDANYLYQYGHYYSISTNTDFIIQREENTRRALQIMPMARRMTKIISWFPFVRAVLISGSLSKNVITPDGDIDYFIITGRGRLWVTRTLLVLFKKIFLLNSHKYFCINYFIDDTHLEIEEKIFILRRRSQPSYHYMGCAHILNFMLQITGFPTFILMYLPGPRFH